MYTVSMHWRLPAVLLAAITLAAGAAAQSTAPPVQASDPANPQAAVPRAVHSSAFAGYRRQAEPTPIAWREANDTVTRIGGWRAYAREAAEPSAPAASTPPHRTAP